MTEGNPFARAGAEQRVRPLKMSDQVAAQVRRMIVSGELVDGDWLPPEAELIRRFGVSRPTLREALRLLEGDALVTIRRGPPGGARVTVPGPDAAARLFAMVLMLSGTTIGDVWDARLVIEPPAVRRLAQTASRAQLTALDDELGRVCAAAEDPRGFHSAGVSFHLKLVELSGNHTLAAVIGMLSEIIERELATTVAEIGSDSPELARANRRALRSYEKIAALIHAGDGEAAEQAWRDHMTSARRYLTKVQHRDRVIDLLS
ncbi:FadR/GntR family transcriptional regulator [Mycobacterium sp. 050272]|uniref:FadR/GntR family transcriptional regulator n=1 Tax=Mycobacterium sp. 050272 TaxID=3142488 RepID=UPI00319BED12